LHLRLHSEVMNPANPLAHGVLFVKYASILLQALTIQIDEDFLFSLLDLSKIEGASWEAEPEK
jgi:vacuolar protein sorting-associated protein 13A/C